VQLLVQRFPSAFKCNPLHINRQYEAAFTDVWYCSQGNVFWLAKRFIYH
jgi:hypothetical protein